MFCLLAEMEISWEIYGF